MLLKVVISDAFIVLEPSYTLVPEIVTALVDKVVNTFKGMLKTESQAVEETEENVTLTPEEIENLMELKEILAKEPKAETESVAEMLARLKAEAKDAAEKNARLH